jgi:hypothetical protein
MLDLPYTMPAGGYGYQLLSVIEDHKHDCKMHVNFADAMDAPESWGEYLADVARVLARDYAANYFHTTEAEAFAAICSGFKNGADAPLPPQPLTAA